MNASTTPETTTPPTTTTTTTRGMLGTSSPTSYMTSSSPLAPHDGLDSSSQAVGEVTSFLAMTPTGIDRDGGDVNESLGMETTPVVDVEEFLQQKNDEFTLLVLPAIVFLGVLFVLGVTGNFMVLYVYNRKLQKGTIRWFVQALAIFDLLSCLVAIPGEIIDMRNNYTFGSSLMCKVLRTVSMFCTVASGMTLMVVAVERYKRICTPLRKQITPKGAQVIIIVSIVVASIFASPASVVYGPQTTPTNVPHINGTDCSTADVFKGTAIPLVFSAFQFLLFAVGALGLIVLYSLIGRKVWSHAQFRRGGFSAGIHRRMSLFFNGSECSSPTTDDLVFAFPVKKNGPAEATEAAAEENSNTSQGNNDDPKDNPATTTATTTTTMNNNNNNNNPDNYANGDLGHDTKNDLSNDINNVLTKPEKILLEEGSAPDVVKTAMYASQPSQEAAEEASQDVEDRTYRTEEPSKPEVLSPQKDTAKSFEAATLPKASSKRFDRQVSLDQPSSPTDNFPRSLTDTFRRSKPTSRATSRDRIKSGDSSILRGRYRRRSMQHTQADMRRFLHRSESVNSGTRRTTLMLFLITLVYLLSFLPYVVLMIVKVLDEDSLSGRGGGWELAHNILLRSYFINSMANPIIYSFCSRTFRKECAKVLHCRCCKSPLFVR